MVANRAEVVGFARKELATICWDKKCHHKNTPFLKAALRHSNTLSRNTKPNPIRHDKNLLFAKGKQIKYPITYFICFTVTVKLARVSSNTSPKHMDLWKLFKHYGLLAQP
jgi:hypothetical protein